jgi:hypothetical protein
MLTLTYVTQSVQPLGYELDDRGIKVRSQSVVRDIFLFHGVQTGFSGHPVSYLMDAGGSSLWFKAAGA